MESLNDEYNEINLKNEEFSSGEVLAIDPTSGGAIPKSQSSGFVLDPSAFPPLNTGAPMAPLLQHAVSNESMQNYLTPELGMGTIHQAGVHSNENQSHIFQVGNKSTQLLLLVQFTITILVIELIFMARN